MRAGRTLGEDRLGQGVFQFGIRPGRKCTYFALARGHIGRVDSGNDLVIVGLVNRAAKLFVQGQHFSCAVGLYLDQLRLTDTSIQQLLSVFYRHGVLVSGRDGVRRIAGHVAAAIGHHIAYITQRPIAAILGACQVQSGLPAGLGRCALQGRRTPQSQEFSFCALVTRFIAVVIDQVAAGFQINIAARDHLVHPQVARGLLDGDATPRFSGQASKSGVLRLDVQGRLDAAIRVELANAARGRRQVNFFAGHMHSTRIQAQDIASPIEPDLTRGGHLVNAQRPAIGVKGDCTTVRYRSERAVAGDQVDGRRLNANAVLSPEVQANALDHRTARQLQNAAVGRGQRHVTAGVRDVAAQTDVAPAAHGQSAGVVTHQFHVDRMVRFDALGVQIFEAHLGAALDVIGLLDAQEAALAPRTVIGFGLVIGDCLFHLHREVAIANGSVRAHKNIFRHGRGGFDHGVHAVPAGATARNEAQPRGVLVVIRLFGHRLVAGRPRVRAVGHRVVVETRLHAARWAAQRIVDHRNHARTGRTAICHGAFEDAVGIFLVGGHLVRGDHAPDGDRLAQVGDAHHPFVATGVHAQQVNAVTGLVVDVHAGITVQRPNHTATGVDDRAHQLHQAPGHIGGGNFQAASLGIAINDGLRAPRGHGIDGAGAICGVDGAVGKLFVDLGFAVRGQRPRDLHQGRGAIGQIGAPISTPLSLPVADLRAHRCGGQRGVVVSLTRLDGAVDVEVTRAHENAAAGINAACAGNIAAAIVIHIEVHRPGTPASPDAQIAQDALLVIAVMHRIQRFRRAAHRLADAGRGQHEVLARRDGDLLAIQARCVAPVLGHHRNAASRVAQVDGAQLVVKRAIHPHLGRTHLVRIEVG